MTADEAIDVSNGRGNVTGVKTGLYLVYAKPANSARFGYTFVPYLISAPNNEFAMTEAAQIHGYMMISISS